MANRNNDRDRYQLPEGMTQAEQDDILYEILAIFEQRKPIGGWKSPNPGPEDLDAVQEVVNLLDSRGLTAAKASPKPQGSQRSRRRRGRR
tara:strand:- start:217 stop:486 length:270 start_codon:yes stop_codon:yes gene_type:complete